MLVALLLLQAQLSFTTVAQGAVSAIDEPRHAVVRTAAEWQTFWRTHSPETTVPTVDFTRFIVVGVFLGARPTDGFSVEIVSVREENDRRAIEYRERRPDPARLVGQVVTSPFHIVILPLDGEALDFRQLDP